MASTLPVHMRAVQYNTTQGGLERNIAVNEKATLPKAAKSLPKNSVLVKVAYSSLNPVDVKVPESLLGRFTSKPAIPASDYAGTVVQSTLAKVKIGDPVFGQLPIPAFGALAEYAVVTGTDSVNKITDGLSVSDAATIGVAGLTAYQSIAPFVKGGSRVLINGASGGCGTFQVQIAKHLGCNVTAVCSGANAELCKRLGADEVIDYRSTNVIEHLKKNRDNGKPFDLICDNIFVDIDLYWQSHHYLSKTGKFVTIAGRPEFAFIRSMFAIMLLPGFLGGGKRPFQIVVCKANEAEYAIVASWMQAGHIRPVIEETIELNEIVKGYERMKSGRTRGKIVVKVSD